MVITYISEQNLYFFLCGVFKLSQQIVELFEACQQQVSDLKKKELCRTELQREIQLLFPRMFSCFS